MICTKCKQNESEEEHTRCDSCLLKLRKYSRNRRISLRKEGLCTNCGKNKSFEDKSKCHICLSDNAERMRIKRSGR
jgi:hypothetical protein